MFKKLLKNLFLFIAYIAGINFLYQIFDRRRKLYLIAYHSVTSAKNKDKLFSHLYSHLLIDENDFEKHIQYLIKNNYKITNFRNLEKDSIDEKNKKIAIIYFDDGYKDNFLNVLPILLKYGVPATVFVTTGLVNRTHFLWPEKLQGWERAEIFMDWNDIAELSKQGIEIGSHGVSHRKLRDLNDQDAFFELVESKRELENKLNAQINAFCFPYS